MKLIILCLIFFICLKVSSRRITKARNRRNSPCEKELSFVFNTLEKEDIHSTNIDKSDKGVYVDKKIADLSENSQQALKDYNKCLTKSKKIVDKNFRFIQSRGWENNEVPYAARLYKNSNIIGFTGKIDNMKSNCFSCLTNLFSKEKKKDLPTIYYFSSLGQLTGLKDCSDGGNYICLEGTGVYGHVTQSHNNPTNVGREYAQYGQYRITNRSGVAEEIHFRNAPIEVTFHTSRNLFTPLNPQDQPDDVILLTRKLHNYPKIKERAEFWDVDDYLKNIK